VLAGVLLMQAAAPAAEKSGEGTLMVDDKDYKLTRAVAYEAKSDEGAIVVVLTATAITPDQFKEALERAEKGQDYSFDRPYLKLQFSKEGEFRGWSAAAGNASTVGGARTVKAEVKVKEGKVVGKATEPNVTTGDFHYGFDVKFDVALLADGKEPPPAAKRGPAASVKPSVSGKFQGNGKDAKLAHVSAHWREPFSDKPSFVLVFTEKDHSADKKPDFKAGFGDFGSALVISLHENGSIFGCQVVHAAHEKQGFSSLGNIKTSNFEFVDGKIEGELATDGKVETFGETWEVKLKFVVPLGEIPAEFEPKEPKKPAKTASKPSEDKPSTKKPKTTSTPKDDPDAPAPKDRLNVKDLALTKDAADFEYKKLVEHLECKSKLGVEAACAELVANLKAQGWAVEGSDLIRPNSSILHRKRGEATLTIFVKPDKDGSQIRVFTKGLAWDGK
jgi:hypothetical protein